MSAILQQIQALHALGKLRISDHGYNELAEDELFAGELVQGLNNARVIEEYPQYPKGPCVLVLQHDSAGSPVHVVWGIPRGGIGAGGLGDGVSSGSGKMDNRFFAEAMMTSRRQQKLVHEGDYLAEVEVELIESDDAWAPYLSPADAGKLDEVRSALRRNDIQTAAKLARIFRLTPVNAA